MIKRALLFLCYLLPLLMPLTYANNLKNTIHSSDPLLEQKVNDAISPHATLNPYFFTNEQFNNFIEKRLLHVGNYYFAKIKKKFPDAKLVDILFVGSLAGYGYMNGSDVDLHLLIDFNVPCDKGLLNDYLTLLRTVWHSEKISIGNYSVQITPVSVRDEHGGVYSLLNHQWIEKPQREKIPYTKEELIHAIKTHQHELINLEKIYNQTPNTLNCQKLIDYANALKIWRKQGLAQRGITSMENTTFRIMRALGDLSTLTMTIQKCETHTVNSLLNPEPIKMQ
ncbi:hypothetical protein [Legionella maioricensis]|uniref:Polymerase nucleotidyl transferase domain-containing protein n=1 Tax=Legionella maioricensis TaxID=2896528 RepID=A0A9X2IBK9_9GAMM|nr:hypothetical protein [Legionella maioricensis]MCL9683497.1 hypothetical protein [Legionella maioricensis]MCL9686796.1 hypothetical protein [Legionella maioricensis]